MDYKINGNNDWELTSDVDILREIKRILTADKNINPDCIALTDVLSLIKDKRDNFDKLIKSCNLRLKEHIKYKFDDAAIIVYGFNYDTDELKTKFRYNSKNYHRIKFAKKDGSLYVTQSESLFAYNILHITNDILLEYYDYFMQHGDYHKQYAYDIKPVNSNFGVNISIYKIRIYVQNNDDCFSNCFELNFYGNNKNSNVNCKSFRLKSLIKNNEKEILDHIYVKIVDCPKWTQEELYDIRKRQLEEGKQKKLTLKNKLFSCFKKY